MTITKLWDLVQSRPGLHTLPIEQGRLPGQPSYPTSACSLFALHRLWMMSSINIFQGPEACEPLPHCFAAKGLDMKTITSS